MDFFSGVIKHWPQATWEGKLFYLNVYTSSDSLPLREAKGGIQRLELKQ